MNENELLTNAKRREENMNKVEVLDKTSELFDSKVAQEVRSRLLDIAHDSE